MYMRTVTFKIDPASIPQFIADGQPLKERAQAMPGMITQYIGLSDDGTVLSVAIWESEAAANAAMPTVKTLWGALARHMRSEPQYTVYGTAEKVL